MNNTKNTNTPKRTWTTDNYPKNRKSKITQDYHNNKIKHLNVTCTVFNGHGQINTYECDICHNNWVEEYRMKHFCEHCTGKRKGSGQQKMSHDTYQQRFVGTSITLLGQFTGSHSRIKVQCNKCSHIWNPVAHGTPGGGCPNCANIRRAESTSRVYYDKPTTLYLIYFPKYKAYKYGITTRTVKERFCKETAKYVILHQQKFSTGRPAWEKEQFLLKAHKKFKYTKERFIGAGHHELFTRLSI